MSIHGDVSGIAVVWRWIDQIDSAPFRHFRRDLRPMLAVVSCDVDQSIVRSGPERSLFYRRFRERKNRVVIFDRSNVVRQGAAAWLLFTLVVACEIAADLRPGLSVIGGFENAFAARVEDVRIVR